MDFANIVFWVLFALSLGGAIGLINSRNPLYAVLFLVLTMLSLAGLYVSLHAQFIGVIQVIVYAGAIMVLFLFMITTVNLTEDQFEVLRFDWRRGLAFLLGLGFLAQMAYALRGITQIGKAADSFHYGKVEPIGQALMTNYLFPFEMISLILLAALMGALVIAKRHN